MKNFLSKLWSLSRTDRVRTLAIDAVSLPSFCRVNMLKLVSVLVILLTIGIGNVWGAEGANHDFSQTISHSLNYGYTPDEITIAEQSYTIKEVIITYSSNKSSKFSASVSVKGNSWGTKSWTKTTNTTTYTTISYKTSPQTSTKGAVTISFTNTAGNSETGQGTLSITNVRLVEGASAAPAYTITAQSNNNSYGTVSLSGTTITATPNSGYLVMSGTDGYTVTSGTATVVNNGDNTFTVTPSSNCTVQINFESKGCTDHGASSITGGALSDADHGPLHAYYDYSTSQILYTKSDLDLAAGKKGTIKSIYFEYSGAAAMAARTIKIYMANTALTELTTGNYVPFASFTEVYDGSFSCGSAGWYEITLDKPFDYNGVGQLAVMIDDNTEKYESSKSFKYHSATGKQIYKRQDDTDIDPASWTPASAIDYRPNTKFCIQEADMVPATVTLMDNGATITEASAGAGVVLPSRTGCDGYTFAGWTKSWVTAQTTWTTTAPTIIPAGSYTPSTDENLYPVYTKTEGGGTTTVTKVYSGTNTADVQFSTGSNSSSNSLVNNTGYTAGNVNVKFAVTSGTNYSYYDGSVVRFYANNTITITPNSATITKVQFVRSSSSSSNSGVISTTGLTASNSNSSTNTNEYTGSATSAVTFTNNGQCRFSAINVTYTYSSSTTSYISVPRCCTDPELAYGTGSVTKTYGEGVFTNTLTNSHSVAVTYSSSDPTVATVNGSGQVTILKAGSTTITASSAAQTVAAVSYCADEASYTLTVNKANISPTLTYDPAAVTVGSTLTSFTLSGNSGSGSVSYSSSNDAIATVNSSGVVTGVAPGTVTITATIAATTNYNGNTATSNTITVNAAACTGVNSLHTGNKDQGGWVTNQCFEDADWGAADDAIYVGAFPLTNECYVGWAGGNSYYGAYWAVGGIKTYDIPTGRTLGWNSGNYYESYPGGALGTFHIYKNSKDENYYLRFKPSSYILRTGSNETSWTSREMTVSATNSHYYETAELDLTTTLISEHAYVDLKTSGGDGHVWCNFSNDRTASGNVKVKSSVGDADGNFRGDNLKASDNGTHGKFRIDITKDVDNWKLAFVPMYRITYAAGTGASGSMDPSSYAEISTTIAAAANGFTAPTGKQFNGWSDGVNSYAAGANVTMNSNVTLTAQWTDIDYTVTVNQSPDVSATTTGQTSSAHYNGTINLTTTVPSGYRFVNWTTSDGFSITNPTSATTASFTMPAKNVTVTANFQQTHKVDWYVGGSAVGNKIGDDGQTTVVDHGGKIEDFPAHDPDGSACEKTFVGWTNTSSYKHGTSPLFNDVAGSPTINADASFYAVFATESGGSSTVFSEDFSTCSGTGGNSGGWSGSIASASVPSGISTSWYLSKANAADECLKLGTGSAGGSAETPDIDCGTATSATLTFRAGAWDGSSEGTTLSLSASNCSIDKSSVTLVKGSFTSYTVAITSITDDIAITFYTSSGNQRFFLDDVVVTASTLTYTGHTITCSDCGTSVTPTYTAAPTGGTVSVTKSTTPVTSGSTVKTCTAVDLMVTITPASHYTLTGFTATGLSTGTATISPAVGSTLPKTTETTFTVTVSAGATGTLNLTPTFTEDAHVAINWNVNGVNQSIAATEGLTWVYSGGDLTALPSNPSVPAGCSGTKVFAGWSTKHSDATEQDAAWYDDLFTAVGDAPTGISSAKTFYAVFATSSANPLAGTVMWDEPWTGTSDKTTPSSPSSGATVYNSTSLTYAYTNGNTTTQVYADGTMYSGGAAAPELLISKTSPSGVWTVTNIPTGGSAQTELTLSYKTNKTTIAVTSGTSGITIGDATVDGNTYTHTITISHSPSTINNFSLIFTNTGSSNARLDDIHLVVPGSGTMTDYVTLCAPSYTITYNKNTSDPVTNLPSPTSVLQSTGSGTLSSTVPERATYTFSGWAETTSGDVAYVAGGSITGVSADKTLYAVWTKTPVEELSLNYSELNKYVGDPAVTLEVTGVTPEGADPSVTWSSSNSSVASVVAATGVVTFGTIGTATITATSTVTGTTTAYCYVTVRNKPTATFVDLIHDGNGTDLSTYHMQNVAGTSIVFPTLDDYATPGDDCDSKHYVFVGWTTSDNNDDPQDHLVASGELEDDQDKVFYAVWADGVEGVSYTQLTTSTFKTSPTKYVIGAIDGDDTFYFYSCAATDANNGNGGCTNAPGTNAPIQFTLSGTANALVATSTEASARYLTPLTAKNFQMSATSKTIQLNDDGTIANPSDESWTLRFNTSEDYLRWYSSATGNAAYFYEVTAGAAVSYRTSCCTNNVPAPTVVATNTAYTVTLTWAAVDGATGYEVSWNGGAFEAATSPCVKSGLTASTDYIYKVRATYDPLVKCGALVASGSVTTDDVYSVTYSGGTGTGSCSPSGSVAPASYEAGATVTLAPTNSFSLTSNTFAAWVVKDADDNDVPVSNNQFTMPAKNVTVTATWTAVQDKYYDRMHDGTDGSHGGIADGEGKYYLALEGCNYTVPTLTDDNDGDTDCHTTHYKLLGWIAQSHLKTDGSGEIKPDEESYIFQGGGTKSATGATYYAVWAIMTE